MEYARTLMSDLSPPALDVLILCQGTVVYRRGEFEPEGWDRVMAVNVKAIFLMSREAIPLMEKNGGGSIINTASIAVPTWWPSVSS